MDRQDNKRGYSTKCRRNYNVIESLATRTKKWIGHILRGDDLMKDVLEGTVEDERRGKFEDKELDYWMI